MSTYPHASGRAMFKNILRIRLCPQGHLGRIDPPFEVLSRFAGGIKQKDATPGRSSQPAGGVAQDGRRKENSCKHVLASGKFTEPAKIWETRPSSSSENHKLSKPLQCPAAFVPISRPNKFLLTVCLSRGSKTRNMASSNLLARPPPLPFGIHAMASQGIMDQEVEKKITILPRKQKTHKQAALQENTKQKRDAQRSNWGFRFPNGFLFTSW